MYESAYTLILKRYIWFIPLYTR